VNPGATEICDDADVDEDCNGVAEDDDSGLLAATATSWYPDADGDGYGAADDAGSVQCDADATYALEDNSDCDDGDAAINPGAAEVCDEDDTDEDCDGLSDDDDGDATGFNSFYADTDSDGYGDPDNVVERCDATASFLEDDTDCDDGNRLVNPGAEEIWYDGADQDCDGASDYDADGDGFDSDDYSGDDCDDEDATVNPDGTDDSEDGSDQNCDGIDGPVLSVIELGLGDLVISEVMQNPDAVLDSVGEWFEIYNASGQAVDLDGLYVYDAGTNSFTVSGSAIVEADGYFVFANDIDTSSNGGFQADYEFSTSDMALANSDDELYLDNGRLEIDGVEWDNGASFPDPIGASMTLDPDSLDYVANDVGTNWCEATSLFGDGDLGTPGDANDSCGADWEGVRELQLDIFGYGTVCDMWWDSYGTASSNICTDCDWAYDLEFTYLGDDLGGCDGEDYLPEYTVGLHLDYYFAGYGTYDMLMLEYGGTWYTQFFVTSYGGGHIEYQTEWDSLKSSGYLYLYYWYGEADY